MPRFAANLSFLYPELPLLERFGAAAEDGFRGVEFLFPYDHAPQVLAARLRAAGLQQVLFNAPPGDWAAGDRGLAALPDRQAEFRQAMERALQYAQVLQCPRIHVMSGRVRPGDEPQVLWRMLVDNLRWAAGQAQARGVGLLVEPINSRDMPGYLLNRQDQAHALVMEVDAPNLQVQMDLYHCQIMEGDLSVRLRQFLPSGRVGHIQVASVPDRHEPDGGELNHPFLFGLLDELGYAGWVGCEYRPRRPGPGGTRSGLGWMRRWVV
ncbi:MAG: hydroxypyruvate isomerase family protein [Rhodoferax sp.]|nr:hydroxypyruvate isomerase family protein [Rhodoferax sp.]